MPSRNPHPASQRIRQALDSACLHACILLVLASVSQAKSMPRPHRQPRQIVRLIEHLEVQWRTAELAANTTAMSNMLAEDYLGIGADGTLSTKAQTLAAFQDGSSRFTRIDPSERKIRVFGTTAVVVSKADVAGRIDSESIDGRYRYTRVYHRINGAWKIVSFEASSMRTRRHGHE